MLKNPTTICAISLFCLFLAPPAGAATVNATADVNLNTLYQQLDGFGGSGAWYEGGVVTYGNSHPEIYNILFRDLGLDIYRVRNTYGIDSGYITRSATIIAAANTALGRPLRIMNTSWSPRASLKNNGSTVGGTLAKDANGNYRYADFAQWWADSLTAWSNAGVTSYYVNMQNEPHWTAGWDTCYLGYLANDPNARYEPAFAALCTKLNSLPSRPLLLAPEGQDTTLTPNYVNTLTPADKANVYGYSHHLYNGSADYPDNFIGPMTTLKAALAGDNKPLLQTEFSKGGPFVWTDAMNLAKLIYNAMTVEGASAYLYWELFWPSPSGLVSVSSTSYTINSVYYAMKHYSCFTDPGWYRAGATTTSSDLRITAFRNITDTNTAIVILNTSTTNDVNLTFSLDGFAFAKTVNEIYRSTSTSNWTYIGPFYSNQPMVIPAQSITTIHLATYDTCAAVQANGDGLPSDLNGDCYVDFDDLEIMADNWLHSDCGESNNWCDLADYWTADGSVDFVDFDGFAQQWMQCNNPLDPNCTQNW